MGGGRPLWKRKFDHKHGKILKIFGCFEVIKSTNLNEKSIDREGYFKGRKQVAGWTKWLAGPPAGDGTWDVPCDLPLCDAGYGPRHCDEAVGGQVAPTGEGDFSPPDKSGIPDGGQRPFIHPATDFTVKMVGLGLLLNKKMVNVEKNIFKNIEKTIQIGLGGGRSRARSWSGEQNSGVFWY